MTIQNKRIGFIGSGNMGEAMIRALIKSDRCGHSSIHVSDVNKERLSFMQTTYGIQVESDNIKLFSICDIIVLAIKPQNMNMVLSELADNINTLLSKKRLIISIAAGFPIKKIEAWLYPSLDENLKQMLPVIRVMPNTPALVLSGASGMSPNFYAKDTDKACTKSILEAMGIVKEFKEDQMDAVTALSGSGPAYLFFLAESMIEAGIILGLNPNDSVSLSVATLKGAVKLMEDRDDTPEILRRKVTSKGGTTEAAFEVFNKNRVKQIIIEAITAAAKRSQELSTKL